MGPFEDVFPITDLRNSYSYYGGENIVSERPRMTPGHSSQMLPHVSGISQESVFRLVAHPWGISRHRGCFLGKEPPQILAQKTLASYNNLHTCNTFANGG